MTDQIDRGVRLLISVAKQLSSYDWSSCLKLTPDFVVYVAQMDGVSWKHLPKERRNGLRKDGWL